MADNLHKWMPNNTCFYCGLHRKLTRQKLLMAITDQRPYDHYQTASRYIYWFKDEKDASFDRPPCKKNNQTLL
jgi:hypothetical protein